MTTVRLSSELEEKLYAAAKTENLSKSDVVKEALAQYFSREEEKTSWELGESYFGKYGSGDGNLSSEYKNKMKGKISAKLHLD
jgi:predicted DNA-binding protein